MPPQVRDGRRSPNQLNQLQVPEIFCLSHISFEACLVQSPHAPLWCCCPGASGQVISYISTYVKVDCDSDDPDNCFCNTGSGRCLRLRAGVFFSPSGPSCRLMARVVRHPCSNFCVQGGMRGPGRAQCAAHRRAWLRRGGCDRVECLIISELSTQRQGPSWMQPRKDTS